MTDINCDCEAVSPYRTLTELRGDCMVGLGYAAQKDNPPPGMLAEIDLALRSAQRLLYRKHKELRTERYFRWTMTPNVRYYGFADSDEGTDIDLCQKKLDPYTVKWVGLEDLNGKFSTLTKGINPEAYTQLAAASGYPYWYELRGCIEVFPAPREAYHLWVLGHFGLDALTAPSDRTTLDDEGVFLLALGNLKSAKGKPDAQRVLTQASTYEQGMVAGTHGSKRYIPGVRNIPPASMPILLPTP